MVFSVNDIRGIIKNAPIQVNFAGLTGNTMAMQSFGWQLGIETCVSEYMDGYTIRLAGKHPGMDLKCVSYPFRLGRGLELNNEFGPNMMFDLHICAREIIIHSTEMPKFRQVDWSKPYFEPMENLNLGAHFSFEECLFFRPLNDQTDIYVPEKKIWTIMEGLKEIKELQDERQKEIREKMRKKKRREGLGLGESPNEYDQRKEVKLQLIAI